MEKGLKSKSLNTENLFIVDKDYFLVQTIIGLGGLQPNQI